LQRWHDFPGEQPHRNSGLLEAHGTEDHMARNIIHSGFAREFLKVVKHRLGRTGDAMTDRGELVKTPRVSRRERKIDSRSLKKKFQRLAPRPIGLVRDASRLSVCFRNPMCRDMPIIGRLPLSRPKEPHRRSVRRTRAVDAGAGLALRL